MNEISVTGDGFNASRKALTAGDPQPNLSAKKEAPAQKTVVDQVAAQNALDKKTKNIESSERTESPSALPPDSKNGDEKESQPQTSPPTKEALEETITKINDFVQSIQRELHFSIDEESGETVVKVVEKATNEVVRQIPAEDIMETLKNLNQNTASGVIISKQA